MTSPVSYSCTILNIYCVNEKMSTDHIKQASQLTQFYHETHGFGPQSSHSQVLISHCQILIPHC